ncbi:MAG: hypothetical protein R3A47_10255 [Polyangiales bacterium]
MYHRQRTSNGEHTAQSEHPVEDAVRILLVDPRLALSKPLGRALDRSPALFNLDGPAKNLQERYLDEGNSKKPCSKIAHAVINARTA